MLASILGSHILIIRGKQVHFHPPLKRLRSFTQTYHHCHHKASGKELKTGAAL